MSTLIEFKISPCPEQASIAHPQNASQCRIVAELFRKIVIRVSLSDATIKTKAMALITPIPQTPAIEIKAQGNVKRVKPMSLAECGNPGPQSKSLRRISFKGLNTRVKELSLLPIAATIKGRKNQSRLQKARKSLEN